MEKIKIGLDFDGVVAYNPFRIIRGPIKFIKRKFLGVKGLTFFVPKNTWERWMWTIIHESSVLPGIGIQKVRVLSQRDDVELYLITARYGFLKKGLYRWLKFQKLEKCFVKIIVNEQTIQPHLFKAAEVEKLKLDYFVEDNFDIVSYMAEKVNTKVIWIYNILDRNRAYKYKYPYLGKALEFIETDRGLESN